MQVKVQEERKAGCILHFSSTFILLYFLLDIDKTKGGSFSLGTKPSAVCVVVYFKVRH